MRRMRMEGWLALALGLCLARCASQPVEPLVNSNEMPAAEGTLQTSAAKNDNTNVQVEVKHLARPQNVVPGATDYIVWVWPDGKDFTPQNVGSLSVDSDLTGRLTTEVPYRDFSLFITPESSGSVMKPTHDPVLSTSTTAAE